MRTTSRFLPVLAVAALGLAACGGSDSDESETSEAPEATTEISEPTEEFTEDSVVEDTAAPVETEPAPVETEPAPVETDAPPATTPATEAPVDTEPAVGETPAAGAAVTLDEWSVEAPAEYTAGDVTFTATNNGGFPHEFVVIQGEGYESLPLGEGGEVLEDDLPTGALLGRTARLSGGSSEDLTVTLAPGNYVLLCNLGSGATSHAGQGQRLDITVT